MNIILGGLLGAALALSIALVAWITGSILYWLLESWPHHDGYLALILLVSIGFITGAISVFFRG